MSKKNVINSKETKNELQHDKPNSNRNNHTPITLLGTNLLKLNKGLIIMKKYEIRCSYCGATIKKPVWWLKLHFIFNNSYTLNCPICHKKSRWITHFTLKHDQDHKERIFNKSKLFDDRL